MPIKECEINGVKGFKWGNSGKCFTGPEGRKNAEKQAAAAHAEGFTGDETFEPPEAGNAPEGLKKILSAAYSNCRSEWVKVNPHRKDNKENKKMCASTAWTAVKKAGWKETATGWILEKTTDLKLFIGDSETFKATIDETTGFLTAPVKLARVGVQHYMGFELGLEDRALESIGVFRSPEEVFHRDSIKSFVNLVVTDDHPTTFVDINNVKILQKGQVSEVKKMDNVLDGIVTVTDKDQISKAKDGKLEVSVGYSNDLKELKGTYEGVEYEFVQTNIRANHLAIVDAGRCGSACKITMDKKEKLVKITIDGLDYEADERLAQAIQKQQSAHDAETKGLKKKEEEDEEEIEKLNKEKEKAEATKDALEKSTLDDAGVNKLVGERAQLIADATLILGDKMLDCTDCPKEIKAAVIDKVLDMGDLSAKPDAYIDAMYDAALKQSKKSKTSLDNLSKDFKDKDGKPITRDSIRVEHNKKMGMEV